MFFVEQHILCDNGLYVSRDHACDGWVDCSDNVLWVGCTDSMNDELNCKCIVCSSSTDMAVLYTKTQEEPNSPPPNYFKKHLANCPNCSKAITSNFKKILNLTMHLVRTSPEGCSNTKFSASTVGGDCKKDEFRCSNTRCISVANVCDGVCDCGCSCEDENNCGTDTISQVYTMSH